MGEWLPPMSLSQLETITPSFAICGVLMDLVYFHKPQNISKIPVSGTPAVYVLALASGLVGAVTCPVLAADYETNWTKCMLVFGAGGG